MCADAIIERPCFVIDKYMMAMYTVGVAGFCELLIYIESGYAIPTRGTIASRIKNRHVRRKMD